MVELGCLSGALAISQTAEGGARIALTRKTINGTNKKTLSCRPRDRDTSVGMIFRIWASLAAAQGTLVMLRLWLLRADESQQRYITTTSETMKSRRSRLMVLMIRIAVVLWTVGWDSGPTLRHTPGSYGARVGQVVIAPTNRTSM